MDMYVIDKILPKHGILQPVHHTLLRRPCRILRMEIGRRGWLLVDVGDEELGPHRISLSKVVSVQGTLGDSEICIETEYSFYCLRRMITDCS